MRERGEGRKVCESEREVDFLGKVELCLCQFIKEGIYLNLNICSFKIWHNFLNYHYTLETPEETNECSSVTDGTVYPDFLKDLTFAIFSGSL